MRAQVTRTPQQLQLLSACLLQCQLCKVTWHGPAQIKILMSYLTPEELANLQIGPSPRNSLCEHIPEDIRLELRVHSFTRNCG